MLLSTLRNQLHFLSLLWKVQNLHRSSLSSQDFSHSRRFREAPSQSLHRSLREISKQQQH